MTTCGKNDRMCEVEIGPPPKNQQSGLRRRIYNYQFFPRTDSHDRFVPRHELHDRLPRQIRAAPRARQIRPRFEISTRNDSRIEGVKTTFCSIISTTAGRSSNGGGAKKYASITSTTGRIIPRQTAECLHTTSLTRIVSACSRSPAAVLENPKNQGISFYNIIG